MTTFIVYPLLCTAMYYLLARAVILAPLHDRYPETVAAFFHCPACSGFWYGLAVAGLGAWQGLPFLGLAPRSPVTWIAVALCAVVWTPLLAALHIKALYYIQNDPDGQDE